MSEHQKAIITAALAMYSKGDINTNAIRAMLALIGMQVVELDRASIKVKDPVYSTHNFTL